MKSKLEGPPLPRPLPNDPRTVAPGPPETRMFIYSCSCHLQADCKSHADERGQPAYGKHSTIKDSRVDRGILQNSLPVEREAIIAPPLPSPNQHPAHARFIPFPKRPIPAPLGYAPPPNADWISRQAATCVQSRSLNLVPLAVLSAINRPCGRSSPRGPSKLSFHLFQTPTSSVF